MNPTRHLDPRAWLLWLASATLPVLMGRNPFPLLAVLLVVLGVRAAWAPSLGVQHGWGSLRRLLLIVAAVSVVFNLLTAPYGNQVMAHLPEWWPLGDVLTLNALIYGLLTALAIVTLVLAGTTAGLLIDWPTMLQLLPARLLTLAVAASVAWAFIPQTLNSFRDIREAQAVRGVRARGVKGLVPFVVPLLVTGLDRATTLAEALEARGFGGTVTTDAEVCGARGSRLAPGLTVVALTLATLTAYFLIVGFGRAAVVAGIGTVAAAAIGLRLGGHQQDHRTRYRNRRWQRQDTLVAAASAASLGMTLMSQALNGGALHYEPYPDITVPYVSLPLLFGLALLLAPALVAPAPQAAEQSPRRTSAPNLADDPIMTSATRQTAWWTRRSRPWAAFETRCRGPIPPRFRRPVVETGASTKRAA